VACIDNAATEATGGLGFAIETTGCLPADHLEIER
jgi:hypothetical protein